MTTPNIVIVLSDYNNETILWVQPYEKDGECVPINIDNARGMVYLFQVTMKRYGYIHPLYAEARPVASDTPLRESTLFLFDIVKKEG